MRFMKAKMGFTLAEVLITLGIIGVVAAMTLPGLIAKWQNQVYVAQLQKAVNTLENGFKLALAEDGVDKLENTVLFNSISGSSFQGDFRYNTVLRDKLKKYFNTSSFKNDTYEISTLTPGALSIQNFRGNMQLLDGSSIMLHLLKTPTIYYPNQKDGGFIGYVWIDVNGKKKPNTSGRDIFSFYLSLDGRLLPYYSKGTVWLYCGGRLSDCYNYWRNSKAHCGEAGKPINVKDKVQGSGCAARIIENGWKMDY